MTKRFIPIGFFLHVIVYQSAHQIEPKAQTITFPVASSRVCLGPLYQRYYIESFSFRN